jgi:hypothetical protein
LILSVVHQHLPRRLGFETAVELLRLRLRRQLDNQQLKVKAVQQELMT